ncbi:MAG TPA: hypothetical protein VFQ00_11855 [Terriglobales bacterium]|nr:hypothetical protein [Terriglobales bacterium]
MISAAGWKPFQGRTFLRAVALLFPLSMASLCWAQGAVSGNISFDSQGGNTKLGSGDIVVWLTPPASELNASPTPAPKHAQLIQKNKHFTPELLVIPVGSSVEFPNRDPFFHNVFSLFNGKRFDLGLYQAGETRAVRFDRVGVSYIFCNIHPEMHAIIVALNTPFYAVTRSSGAYSISNVPPGNYELHVWSERAGSGELSALQRTISVSDEPLKLSAMHLRAVQLTAEHKNKFGKDYDRNPATLY